jgi:hypothetical protein
MIIANAALIFDRRARRIGRVRRMRRVRAYAPYAVASRVSSPRINAARTPGGRRLYAPKRGGIAVSRAGGAKRQSGARRG